MFAAIKMELIENILGVSLQIPMDPVRNGSKGEELTREHNESALRGDCVAKLDDKPSARNNRIMAHKVLNQDCALAPALESILLILASKIVLQHNPPQSRLWRIDLRCRKRAKSCREHSQQ